MYFRENENLSIPIVETEMLAPIAMAVLWPLGLGNIVVPSRDARALRIAQPRIFGGTFTASDQVPRACHICFGVSEAEGAAVGQVARLRHACLPLLAVPRVQCVQGFGVSWVRHPHQGLSDRDEPYVWSEIITRLLSCRLKES